MARAATSTRTNGSDHAKELDAEIAALRDDIAAITATLGDMARDTGREVKSEARKATKKAVAKGEEAIETVHDNFESVEGEIKTLIRDKPIASVLVAAGVGYVLSKII